MRAENGDLFYENYPLNAPTDMCCNVCRQMMILTDVKGHIRREEFKPSVGFGGVGYLDNNFICNKCWKNRHPTWDLVTDIENNKVSFLKLLVVIVVISTIGYILYSIF